MSVPGRPSTVPAVTLSWREAESFEIGVPDAEDSERAIVVEPPSQLVAERRSRRRDLDIDTEGDAAADPVVVEPLPATAPVEEAPATRASARAASGYQSGKRRRAMVVGLVLVMLAIVAWYFLLRGDGDDAAAGPDRTHRRPPRCRRAVADRPGVRCRRVARLGAEPTALRRKGFARR